MSDSFLVVIPADPLAKLPDTAERVRALLAEIAGTDASRVKDYGKLQFIDCGENFETIRCPACRATIDIPQWHAWMDADWHADEGFHLHDHTTPCCGKTLTLDALVYEGSQGFARWCISAKAGNRGALKSDEVARLEAIAAMPLRAINQRY